MGHIVNPYLFRLNYVIFWSSALISKKKFSSYFDTRNLFLHEFINVFFRKEERVDKLNLYFFFFKFVYNLNTFNLFLIFKQHKNFAKLKSKNILYKKFYQNVPFAYKMKFAVKYIFIKKKKISLLSNFNCINIFLKNKSIYKIKKKKLKIINKKLKKNIHLYKLKKKIVKKKLNQRNIKAVAIKKIFLKKKLKIIKKLLKKNKIKYKSKRKIIKKFKKNLLSKNLKKYLLIYKNKYNNKYVFYINNFCSKILKKNLKKNILLYLVKKTYSDFKRFDLNISKKKLRRFKKKYYFDDRKVISKFKFCDVIKLYTSYGKKFYIKNKKIKSIFKKKHKSYRSRTHKNKLGWFKPNFLKLELPYYKKKVGRSIHCKYRKKLKYKVKSLVWIEDSKRWQDTLMTVLNVVRSRLFIFKNKKNKLKRNKKRFFSKTICYFKKKKKRISFDKITKKFKKKIKAKKLLLMCLRIRKIYVALYSENLNGLNTKSFCANAADYKNRRIANFERKWKWINSNFDGKLWWKRVRIKKKYKKKIKIKKTVFKLGLEKNLKNLNFNRKKFNKIKLKRKKKNLNFNRKKFNKIKLKHKKKNLNFNRKKFNKIKLKRKKKNLNFNRKKFNKIKLKRKKKKFKFNKKKFKNSKSKKNIHLIKKYNLFFNYIKKQKISLKKNASNKLTLNIIKKNIFNKFKNKFIFIRIKKNIFKKIVKACIKRKHKRYKKYKKKKKFNKYLNSSKSVFVNNRSLNFLTKKKFCQKKTLKFKLNLKKFNFKKHKTKYRIKKKLKVKKINFVYKNLLSKFFLFDYYLKISSLKINFLNIFIILFSFANDLNVFFFIKSFWSAYITSDMIAELFILRLLQRKLVVEIMKPMIRFLNKSMKKKKIYGYAILLMGRFTRKDRATYKWYKRGPFTKSNRLIFIDYANRRVALRFSSCSFKINLIKTIGYKNI